MTIDEPGYFEQLARVEAAHWWSQAMWELASDWLAGAIRGRSGLAALDVGCGSGMSMLRIVGHREVARVVGLEPDLGALRLARRHRGFELVRGSAMDLPFGDECFDVMTCFDVLQHLPEGGDRVAASEFARVLRPGGVVVVRSNSAGFGPGRSRGGSAYRLAELTEMLVSSGLNLSRRSYVNALPSLAQEARGRLRGLAGARGRSWISHPSGGGLRIDVPSPGINRLMGAVAGLERKAMGLGFNPPFGHSTMVMATRPISRGGER